MTSRKNLLVTFPVDLGNRTVESNLHEILSDDAYFFRFAAQHSSNIDRGRISVPKSIWYRIKSIIPLRFELLKHRMLKTEVIFHGISPALFGFSLFYKRRTTLMVDWTRALYPTVQGEVVKKDFAFYIHKTVLKFCSKIICWTKAVEDNLVQVYGVDRNKIYKSPAPFLIEKIQMKPRPTPKVPRVLFVGGDFLRKGGDVIIESWSSLLKDKCSLTMVTNYSAANIEGIKCIKGVTYGTAEHRRIFEEHDIMILPTRMDSYPQVIGEAAAAGQAVITTTKALGAMEVIDHGITGFISDTPEGCITYLLQLLDNRHLIDEFKKAGFELMADRFSRERIRNSILQVVNS